MDETCEFLREYLPQEEADTVLRLHVENCVECQGEVRAFGVEATWSVQSA